MGKKTLTKEEGLQNQLFRDQKKRQEAQVIYIIYSIYVK